ncbi:MAG: 16S rRNA (adenine(1518)-N(6)/adenine(1519)-N(6))-dimethyltransferase RsmA [Parachlamydiaceae bacterium]
MPIYQPTELRAFLNSINAFPKKGLSQNFLIDGNIVKKIIEEARISSSDTVLEIGPGPGALTEILISLANQVIAVEKDHVFAQHLSRFDQSATKLKIICNDILEADFSGISQQIKVVGNLPYHITTPILVKLLSDYREKIISMTFMVQDEVAKRMVAQPKTADYSALTIFLNFYCDVQYAFKVNKNCFYPSPSVDSAIVTLKPRIINKIIDTDKLFEITRTAFQMRRKTLKKSLKQLYPERKILESLEDNGLTPLVRPEELSVEQFIKLYKSLQT